VSERLGIKCLNHVTLVVRDLVKSRAFYEKFLGLTPISRPNYDFEGLWYQCGNLEIHLLVAEEHPPPSRRHLAFEVTDFDRVITSLDRERIHVASGPSIRPHDGTRYVFLHDPAGNLIEINCSTQND
jgi:glyoxylase I family protein